MKRIAGNIAENSVTIALIVVGIVFIVASGTLPAARFDPLGAGPYPMVLGWLITTLGVLELAKSAWRAWRSQIRPPKPQRDYRQGVMACIALVLTILYGLSMAVFGLRFAIATAIYLSAASFTLQRPTMGRTMLLVLVFTVFAFALEYLLKSVAYVNLP